MLLNTFISGIKLRQLPKLLLVLALSLISLSLHARQLQDLVVTEIEGPSSIPVFRNYPDDAAIIVSSSITNLRFDSNFEVVADDSDPANGEYRIIIRPFRQTITVQANGFKQLRFTVPVSTAREVRFYSIEPLEVEEDLIPTVFALSPPQAMDAAVFIDGQAVDINQGLVNLSPGTHQLRIEKQGYRIIDEEILIAEDQTAIRRFELEPLQPQRITITSSPSEASVELNDVARGNTDLQLFEFPGEYFVRISKAGYKSIQQAISVIEGQDNTFNFVLEEFSGDLSLNVTPSNARVTLNGQAVNLVNGNAKVLPGTYTLRVEANGYRSYTEPLVINEDEVVSRTIALEQITGSLQFTIQPISANITLVDSFGNVVEQWPGSRYLPALPIGSYTIRATAENYQPFSTSLIIREDQTTTLTESMTSISAAELAERQRQQEFEEEQARMAELEEERRQKAAAREKRQSFFKRDAFGGLYIHYNLFEIDGNAFTNNVDESSGFGLGFFKYKNLKTTSLDFVYNSYTMVSNTALPDEIISYNLAASFVPTLPIGPFMIGYGLGLDFTQYEDSDAIAYYYTYDAFLAFQLTFKPKSWGIGFMLDSRNSWDIGLADVYNPWNQVKYSLILSF